MKWKMKNGSCIEFPEKELSDEERLHASDEMPRTIMVSSKAGSGNWCLKIWNHAKSKGELKK